MFTRLFHPHFFYSTICLVICISCNNKSNQSAIIADTPVELQQKATDIIKNLFEKSSIVLPDDSATQLQQIDIAKALYEKRDFVPAWSFEEEWLPVADSLFNLIENARFNGLFAEDYHYKQIKEIKEKFALDTLAKSERKNPMLWSQADVMLTDAFVQIVKDIKLGRLPEDSITLRKDSTLSVGFYQQHLLSVQEAGSFSGMIQSLEPDHWGYHLLKKEIPRFLEKADYKQYTFIPAKDAPGFAKALQRRLFEGGYISFDSTRADSIQMSLAVKKFQKEKGIAVDGRVGEGTIRMLNVNDREKFIRIAISMDKYKMLPEKMPSKYIWVNASANYLDVVDNGKIKMTSKVICGKLKTRTPVLSSAISSLITYPQWVPPPSIVSKEILPAVKRNPGYLSRRGFSLVNSKGEEVDPYSVDWSKYKNTIPYRVVQGSGDANALGVMKFVFDNKYSVYLHDTNQRYLFANSNRSLSHGCVRVQDWQALAFYILRNDSLISKGTNYTKVDSVKTWLSNKQKRSIPVKNKIPVYIRYITCEGKNGGILFYDDVYAEDKMLREKYFANK